MGELETAQALLLKKFSREAYVDGDMVNVTAFLNQQISLRDVATISKAFAVEFEKEGVELVATVPTSGIPIAQEVGCALGRINIFYPRKGKKLPIILKGNDVITKELNSPTSQEAVNLYARRDLLENYRGKDCLIIDDFLFRGNTVIQLHAMLTECGVNVAGIGIVFDKNYDGGENIEKATGLKPFCLLTLEKEGIKKISKEYSEAEFINPKETIRVKNAPSAE